MWFFSRQKGQKNTLLDDIKAVREAAKQILDEKNIVLDSELNAISNDQIETIKEEETTGNSDIQSKSQKKQNSNKKSRKKRISELENLKIEGWKEPPGKRRSNTNTSNRTKPGNLGWGGVVDWESLFGAEWETDLDENQPL